MAAKFCNLIQGSTFLLKIHVTFYCQYAKFRNAPWIYSKVFSKSSENAIANSLKNLWINSVVSPFLLSITYTNYSENAKILPTCFMLIMKILTEKKLDITHFLLRWQSYSIWTATQVSNNTQDETGFPVWKKVIKVW